MAERHRALSSSSLATVNRWMEAHPLLNWIIVSVFFASLLFSLQLALGRYGFSQVSDAAQAALPNAIVASITWAIGIACRRRLKRPQDARNRLFGVHRGVMLATRFHFRSAGVEQHAQR